MLSCIGTSLWWNINLVAQWQHEMFLSPWLVASELKAWLLYYSLPSLDGVLPKKFLQHFALFVEAVYILLGDNISREDLAVAEYFLDTFYKKFADLYGISFCHPSFIPRNHHLDLTWCFDPRGGGGTDQVRLASHRVHSNCGTQKKEFCSASQTLLTGVRFNVCDTG